MEDQKIVVRRLLDRIAMAQTEQLIIQPTSEPCFDFSTDGTNRQKKTVIISPIRIEEYDKRKLKITYGCSRGIFCRDAECRYVKRPKIEREDSEMVVETFSSHLDR
jgi:hypothetical protein